MNFTAIEEMYAMLWDFIYAVLAIFGVEKDGEGNLIIK